MKNLIFKTTIFFVLFSQLVNAQQHPIQVSMAPNQTYSEVVSNHMQELDNDRIPYGVLYDRVVGWAMLPTWKNGNTTDVSHIKQAWWDLSNSKSTPSEYWYNKMKQKIFDYSQTGVIPLVTINYGFGYIDSLAFQDGRMKIENEQLIDMGGASPYITKKVHISAFGKVEWRANVQYKILSSFYFTLSNLSDEEVTGYTIHNLTTGEVFNLKHRRFFPITFTTSGINKLKITQKTSKGSYDTYQDITILPPPMQKVGPVSPTSTAPEHRLLTSDIPFKGYEEQKATISYADYHIYYHYKTPNDTTQSIRKLKKPIIILDGFDPEDKRNYDKIYNEQLIYNGNKLGNKLRSKGYDVVILNFPMTNSKAEEKNGYIKIPKIDGIKNGRRDGGTDYIERNAFLLVKLIQELNAELKNNGSNQKLVIVGPSMGGQISRYALAYMEKEELSGTPNMDHNTRLWLSFDSPHLGANIPLSLQRALIFFGYMGGQQEAREAYETKLNSPAARQMLIEQSDGCSSTAYFHNKYYNDLALNGLYASGGYPQKPRKIALVNGSGAGVTTHYPGQEFLSLKGTKWGYKAVEIITNFLPKTGKRIRLFKGKITSAGWIYLRVKSIKESIPNNNPRGSMDVVPGGIFDAQEEIKTQLIKAIKDKGVKPKLNNIKHNHCFIPTVSALGFKDSNFKWDTPINDRDLVATNEIPFDNYYIPPMNQKHTSLTKQSVEWLMNQLDGNYYNQVKELKIIGPSIICDEETYTIQNLPEGATVEWVDDSFLTVIDGQNTPTATYKNRFSSVMGLITSIVANVHLNGATITVSKSLYFDSPPEFTAFKTINNTEAFSFRTGEEYKFVADEKDPRGYPYSNYRWQIETPPPPPGGTPQYYTLWTNRTLNYMGRIPGEYKIILSANGRCGRVTSVFYKTFYGAYIPEGFEFEMFPNPATDMVTLKFKQNNNGFRTFSTAKMTKEKYKIQLWNSLGLVKEVVTDEQKYRLSLHGIPAGFYYVHIIKGKQVIRKQLIIR